MSFLKARQVGVEGSGECCRESSVPLGAHPEGSRLK